MRYKIRQKSRHSFILAEILIAIVLAALFVSMALSLFYIMSRYTTYQTELLDVSTEQSQKEIAIRRVLSNIQLKRDAQTSKILPPDNFSKCHRFIFCFNNGTDPTPEFSSDTQGMIYVDDGGRLLLVTESIPQQEQEKQSQGVAEVICNNVKKIVWRFAFGPTGDELRVSTKDDAGWLVNPEEANFSQLKAVRLEVWEKEEKGDPSFTVTSLIASHLNSVKIE